jgi:heptosyltransferase-3
MRILLIKPKHIGDTLILTPTIAAIRRDYPQAEIWLVVRRGCEGILAGCPEISRVLTVAPVDKHDRRAGDLWQDIQTLLRLGVEKFDIVFELGDGHRARSMSRVAGGKRRYSVKPTDASAERAAKKAGLTISSFDWKACHRVEKDFRTVAEFLPLAEPIPPLRFDRASAKNWPPADKITGFAVMQIGKRQGISRWRREDWAEVGRFLIGECGGLVITSGAAPYEVEEATWLREKLGDGAIATRGTADWSQVAGLLYRAQLYVGLDTATMHLAAACGCPSVALFGPTIEDHWHPWRVPYRIVTSRGYVRVDDLVQREERTRQRRMEDIGPGEVIAACREMRAIPRGIPFQANE